MADTTGIQWSIREDGCLPVDVNTNSVTYNSSLNTIILSSKDHKVTVFDALSGAFLQKSDLSGHKNDPLECIYLPEKDKMVYCDGCALGVRGDLQGILLLDTALQTGVSKTEDVIKIELPVAEASQLLKTLSAIDLSGKEYVDDLQRDLTLGIQAAQETSQGNHKTAKWATVCLQMQHGALKSVCSALMEELTKTSQTGQGFPVASAVVDRLGFLLPVSRAEIMKEPVNRNLMYSEAARRETFANWPHMNYKWALPEPMAQAGFFHHPSLHGDDRAMCFTCSVCLVCWEPTDEPWSEHERHSQFCPYIKGDYTQNVPLTVTYATQPAQHHDSSAQEKIACVSTTFNEDFIATSTRDGNLVVWDISHILKKYCQFNIDLADAIVALKTGLQIERPVNHKHPDKKDGKDQGTVFSNEQVEEIFLHDDGRGTEGKPFSSSNQRPSDDLFVTAVCVADEAKWREEVASCNSPKVSSSSDAQLSLVCGVSLRRTRLNQGNAINCESVLENSCEGDGGNSMTVQLMNEVNEAVRSESRLITDRNSQSEHSDFVMPDSRLAPYLIVISITEEAVAQPSGQTSPSKKKTQDCPTSGKQYTGKEELVSLPDMVAGNADNWGLPLWEDPDSDCQIVGFTPPPFQNATPYSGSFSAQQDTKHIKDISKSSVPNGPSDLFCDTIDSSISEPLSPTKPFSFTDTESISPILKPFFFPSSSESSENSTVNANGSPKKDSALVSGTVLQCLELPREFQQEHIEISSILPSVDKQHVIVVLSTKVSYLESCPSVISSLENGVPFGDSASSDRFFGGGILVYRLKSKNNRLILEETPVVCHNINSPHDVITSTFLLPMEVEEQVKEQARGRSSSGNEESSQNSLVGHIVLTTASGAVRVLCLSKLEPVVELTAPAGERYISATYCSGIERLCVCSDNGKLHFFDVETLGEKNSMNGHDYVDGFEMNGELLACKRAKMDEDVVDAPGFDFLTNQPLTADTLSQLHSLIEFENLMPRFAAVVPPCWSEIQQEQQQRRHPQHLQQQGEATQHTRTWKLTPDTGSQTWDEHLLEILLPKPCSVGHVDIKFSLNPLCTQQPNIEVTLLKQNIGSMHRPPGNRGDTKYSKALASTSSSSGIASASATFDLSQQVSSSSSLPSMSTGEGATSAHSPMEDGEEVEMINNVLDPKFLESQNAEILCGPVKLANCLDLSGSGGLITLTSPLLLNSKPRSLLLHIKGFENSPYSEPIFSSKEKAEADRSAMEKIVRKEGMMKTFRKKTLGAVYKNMLVDKHKNIKGLFENVSQSTSDKAAAAAAAAASTSKQKLADCKGCDWFQELSVTVRVFKKAAVRNEKQQRNSLIQDLNFQKRLIKLLVTISKDIGRLTVSQEHMQNMTLDILIWILAVQMNDADKRWGEKAMMEAFQQDLKRIIHSCFILGSRTTAHKCSRLLSLCMDCLKLHPDPHSAPAFSHALLQALLDCFHLLPVCISSGSMRWFFALLNRVKCMDMELVATVSSDLLLSIAEQHSQRTLPHQALLKTRYGLYGNPFEAELFDMEVNSVSVPSSSSYSQNTIFTNVLKSCTASAAGSAGSKEQSDLFEMLSPEKAAKNQPDCLRNDVLGLLEVEPLHFRCHATSDGTRMERMDAMSSSSTVAPPAASAFNPAPTHVIPFHSLEDMALSKKSFNGAYSKMYGAKLVQQHQGSASVPAQLTSLSTQQPYAVPTQSEKSQSMQKSSHQKQFAFPQMQGLLQAPPPQVLVIERMHSGARRFVTLDFGKPIVLTDVIIPSSVDLASLSIDVWVEGEEIDGQRLVVASDINTRTLVMNDIMPAPVCRYLKITTVGKYSGGTTRSRIPLGSFYGHTYILPWEWPEISRSGSQGKAPAGSTASASDPGPSTSTGEPDSHLSAASAGCEVSSHSSLLSQLALFISLVEDLQCRFNLARTRLESLLTRVGSSQFLPSHVQYHLKRNSNGGRVSEEDSQIVQAYNECLQLQLQLNLAQRAIHRLQSSLGISALTLDDTVDSATLFKQTSTDKLRVILENVLDTLLTATVGSPAIPQPPVALYMAFTPEKVQALFRHLCLHGSQRIQVVAGLLLVRVCGTQPWWGDFLGNMLQEFFHSQYSSIFPQDRVFVLLSSLGQKSLTGPSALHVLDSLLAMLTSVLQPIISAQGSQGMLYGAGHLDLSLVSWVLLFLCQNMESQPAALSCNSEDSEKGAKRDREGNNRWSFIESQWSGSAATGSRSKSHRSFSKRGFRKLTSSKNPLYDTGIDRIRKALETADKKNQAAAKLWELIRNVTDTVYHWLNLVLEVKEEENVKMLLKDVIDYHKKQKGSVDSKDEEGDTESLLILSRERCMSVVKGLMALLLSMDFTCHVDLFLVACKVLAKICLACRPAISLAEAMTQEQLERLTLLVVDSEFNHDNLAWGGPWAGHAITSLLQDILEGEKLCPNSPAESETDASEMVDPVAYSQCLVQEGVYWTVEQGKGQQDRMGMVIRLEQAKSVLRSNPQFFDFLHRDFLEGTFYLDEQEDPSAVAALFVNKKDKEKWNKFVETVSRYQDHQHLTTFLPPFPPPETLDSLMDATSSNDVGVIEKKLQESFVNTASNVDVEEKTKSTAPCLPPMGSMRKLLNLKNKLTEQLCTGAGIGQAVSTAVDARLEFGLETLAEHRLKVIQSVQMGNVQCAFSSPLPPVPGGVVREEGSSRLDPRSEAETSDRSRVDRESSSSSVEMLSQCFEHMFAQLRTGRVNLECVLQLWLTLNDDHTTGDSLASGAAASGPSTNIFDATRNPVIMLSENAVASLMEVGLMMPCMQVRTWVYLLQALCLLTNQRRVTPQGTDVSLAPCVLNDPNLTALLTKFLWSNNPSSVSGGTQQYQVGPAAVKIFGDLLYRLQCKSIEVNGQQFKEMLLKIVYNLTAERGAIYQCMGPLDAQVQFLEVLSESQVLAVDISNALSVIQAASTLVYQHLSLQDQVVCHTSQDSSSGARSCFGGLVASLLRGSDNRPGCTDSLRDQLMFFLLQLVNKMISASPSSRPSRGARPKASSSEGSSVGRRDLPSVPRRQAWMDSSSSSSHSSVLGGGFSPRLLTNVRLSDDEKSRSMGHQDCETQLSEEDEDTAAQEGEDSFPSSEIADIVVGNPVIMQNLIQSLSHCSSNRLALMFAHTDSLNNLQKMADQSEPITVGDLIFTILKTLKEKCAERNVMVDNLFRYFAGRPPLMSQVALTRLSEPLLFFTLRTLNSHSAIKKFIDLGGMEVVSTNFVRCNQHMVSSSPSIISTLMQNLSAGHRELLDKSKGFESDSMEGLQSFAQLGTITSSSPNANPPDGLIQTVANRRARSATWSYHFYTDEPYVEITIHLPFAVLLKYVHIRPHGAAIATCPSHVSLELSHDGNIVSPASPPLVSSSLALIRLQLQKPEVVTSVTLLLHRPRDSNTIGLQKISLWGQTAFSEGADHTMSLLNEECFSRSSLGWMRILHHCLVMSSEDVQATVARAAASTPNLLATCTSLLVHPLIGSHAVKIETILIKMGLCHNDLGLALLDSILRRPSRMGGSGSQCNYLGKVHGVASPHTVEILYTLGTTQDEHTQCRVEALLQWLEDCSRTAISLAASASSRSSGSSSYFYGQSHVSESLSCPSPEHVNCVAAILWHSVELPVAYPLHRLVTIDFIKSLYSWSRSLPDCNLRVALGNVLCATCHALPYGFTHIQEWTGIVDANGSHIVADAAAGKNVEEHEALRQRQMTDDSKEAAGSSYVQDSITDDSKEAHRLQSLSSMHLDENKLMLLAAVCKSPVAIRHLMNCGLPAMLAQAICEFCNQQMVMAVELEEEEEGAGLESRSRAYSRQGGLEKESPVNASLVSSILRFFTEISSEMELKDWLGQAEGNAFWSLLLTLLCGSRFQPPVMAPMGHDNPGFLTLEERSELETRTIQFFSAVISFHSENQLLFAKVLCDVIKDQGRSKTDLLSAMPLSGFMRRLLLQVLLEDEKITVSVRNASNRNLYDEEDDLVNEGTECFPMVSSRGQIFHPRYGSGRSCQCVTMNLNARCSDVIAKVADALPMSNSWADKKEEKKKRGGGEEAKKEPLGELDVDLQGVISHYAAAAAKEKREKSPLAKTGLPPRPPTRRGRLMTSSADSLLESMGSLRMPQALSRARLRHIALPDKDLPHNLTLSQLLHVLSDFALLPSALALQFVVRLNTQNSIGFKDAIDETVASDETLLSSPPFPSALKVFASVGGLALLAEHLPLLFPEISRQSNNLELVSDNNVSDLGHDWVTVESSDELLDPYLEPITPPHPAKSSKHTSVSGGLMPSIPPHSLIAFGLFLRLPGYAEVLLKERKMAQCLLRLVLGVTDDGDGGQILTSPIAGSLPTMPFTVLKMLFDTSPLTTDDGVLLRRMALDIGVLHLVLACLATLSHHKPRAPLTSFQHETQLILTAMQSSTAMASLSQPEEKNQQHYWAKGTGFGTGSTTSSWDAEQAMLRQKGEEEHVACLLQVLASYMNPVGSLDMKNGTGLLDSASSSPRSSSPALLHAESKSLIPESLTDLLSQSCLVPALSSYLRNDSVLDMARHVPLYRALLQLLRGITVSPTLVPILLPLEQEGVGGQNSGSGGSNGESQACIEMLLEKMKGCVDTYASRLKSNKGKSGNKMEDEESEGLALLIPDIQETAQLVREATQRLKEMTEKSESKDSSLSETAPSKPRRTLEEQYIAAMKELQFDTYELVTEEGRNLKFNVSHHYESNVRAAGTVTNVARTRRLAQEAVTLSTSLPLAFSSSVFVRCDEERLDIMKVLITGPSDTPYGNGCFEFDVFFPQDYPNTPPFINMETTGNHSVRFNPNLYNDGKVCLSVLNTWHGRPEEKWNAQTSSFLQVLVSIQSLILVSEPYFNEPGYERSRGTPSGAASSHEYDANIRQATVKWAMLEQLKNPSACFKEIIHMHFWLKRHEILQQCEKWIGEMESYSSDKRTGRSIAQSTLALKRHYNQLREELAKLKPPTELEGDEEEEAASIDPEAKQYTTSSGSLDLAAGNRPEAAGTTTAAGEKCEAASVTTLSSPPVLETSVSSSEQSALSGPAFQSSLSNTLPVFMGNDSSFSSPSAQNLFFVSQYEVEGNLLKDLLDSSDPDC